MFLVRWLSLVDDSRENTLLLGTPEVFIPSDTFSLGNTDLTEKLVKEEYLTKAQ